MKVLAIVAATLACALAAPVKKAISTNTVALNGVSFSGNVSLADPNQFQYRQTSLASVSVPLFGNLGIYSSIAVDGKGDSSSGSVSVDAIFGMLYFPGVLLKEPPTVWMAYYSADAKVTTAPGKIDASVTSAGSFVATVYRGIIEKKADGTVVKTTKFKDIIFSASSTKEDTTKNLNWITYEGKSGKATIEATLVVSKVVGKLNVGDATITPQSMEVIFEINDYEYADAGNHLDLVMVVGQASKKSAVAFTSTHTLIAGDGDEQIFIKFAGQAVIDGKSVDVQISGYTSEVGKDQLENQNLETQLTSNTEWKASVRTVTVSFPANAKSISYDPSMGVKAPNSSTAVIPFVFSVVVAVILALFM